MSKSGKNIYKQYQSSEKKKLKRTIDKHLSRGLSNGHFNISISGEIGHKGKRILDVQYADNERFTVPEREIESKIESESIK